MDSRERLEAATLSSGEEGEQDVGADDDLEHHPRDIKSASYFGIGRRALGLFLLFITVLNWTITNFLASNIFADNTYSKPYLVTYINTAIFILPLTATLVDKAITDPEQLRIWRDEIRSAWRYRLGRRRYDLDAVVPKIDSPPPEEMMSSQTLLLGDPMESSQVLLGAPIDYGREPPLTLMETARLSLEFCMLWFLANYFVSACLEYTTVASSTILTSTSSVWTLIFGAIFKVERFTLRKLFGVLTSLLGIILISTLDFSGETNDENHRGDFPEKTPGEVTLGNALALLSAVMYGIYASFMRLRIEDESRINMQLFFGLVGLFNVLFLWPGFVVLHLTGIEPFELPPDTRVSIILLLNALSSLIADIAWAYAVLFTSPIVVTVGLSMTIPLSLVGQFFLNSQRSSFLYWVGALTVVLSFLFVNHEEKKEEEEEDVLQSSILGDRRSLEHEQIA